MKKIILLALTVVSLVSVSCKDDKKAGTSDGDNAPVKKNFYVEITAKASQKDDFAVYFTEDGTVDFKPESALWRGFTAGQNETLVYDFPADAVPTHIRIDLGMNKQQDSVVLSNLKVGYFGNVLEIKGSQFFDYFIKDEQFKTSVDAAKGTTTFIKQGAEYKTPYYYPRHELATKIQEMTSGTK